MQSGTGVSRGRKGVHSTETEIGRGLQQQQQQCYPLVAMMMYYHKAAAYEAS